jgi:DNA-binding NarL/FixJ family response regulator
MTQPKEDSMVNKTRTNILCKQTATFGKHLVLLVDDSSIMRSTSSIILEQAGFTIVGEASSGEEAVMLSAKLRPHVVIMDIDMPGMGGIKATARLRTLMPEVEVIGFSISDDKATIDRMMAAGAINFVSKMHINTLVQAVCAAVEHGEKVPAERKRLLMNIGRKP